MKPRAPRLRCLVLPLALVTVYSVTAAQPPSSHVRFNRDIRPILSNRCFACHGPDEDRREADFALHTRELAMTPLASGEGYALVPGKPGQSLLLARVAADESSALERMPPEGEALSAEEIETLRRWIEEGADWELHWSLIPPQRPESPAFADECPQQNWPRNAIDRFVLRRLLAEDQEPAPPADPITLLRRLHFDLIGLPPAAEEVAAFSSDPSEENYRRQVDRLLASPHFGERMAMWWLDLVRYADTVGYHGDQEHAISPYRDYVIAALNQDMPFDQFTIEQLAGDLLPNPTETQKVATGYHRVLQTTHEGGAQAQEYLAKYAADRVRTTAAVWMATTMGCCECHDHKFDPYTLKDFYRFAAFFADIQEKGDFAGSPNTSPTTRPPEMLVWKDRTDELEYERWQRDIERWQQEVDRLALDEAGVESSPAYRELRAQLDAARHHLDEARRKARATMITVSVPPRVTRLLPRGDWMDESGEVVLPGVPAIFGQLETGGSHATRLDLARWLVRRDHPQTARVVVNRLWAMFFGTGLSRVLDDVGSQGEWPTHPELLDWLATELVDSGWSLKHIIRHIVTSSSYRQSSHGSPRLRELDPANRLLARQSRIRLPAEMIRDNALAVSGLLITTIGGPSARPYQPAGYYAHLNFPERVYRHDRDEQQYRRGVYVHWQRQFLHPALKAFDAPSREECTAQRAVSNTPLAALTLLNDPSYVEAARVFAERVIAAAQADADRVQWAFRRLLSRAATAKEVDELLGLLTRQRAAYARHPAAARQLIRVGLAAVSDGIDEVELAAWTAVTRTMINLSEAITRY